MARSATTRVQGLSFSLKFPADSGRLGSYDKHVQAKRSVGTQGKAPAPVDVSFARLSALLSLGQVHD
ncbi:hypothetical protein KCU76_g23, partial [Aureobasidium melanogenum]